MPTTPCPDCFSGTVHLGMPTGTITTIDGVPVYVAQPPEGITPKGIIVMISDAFGWEFVNNRLLADNYAQKGPFLVYLPDFMNGNFLSFTFVSLMEDKIKAPASWYQTLFYKPLWIARALAMILPWILLNRASVAKPRIFNFFTALRHSPPPFNTPRLKIGAAGYCWGGYYAIQLVHNTPTSRTLSSSPGELEPLIDCAFIAHPSMVSMPGDIGSVMLPLSVAVGDEDMAMKGPSILQMKEILEGEGKEDHEVIIMPGAKHGFAVRVNPKDALQSEYAEKAEWQAVEWFRRWFG